MNKQQFKHALHELAVRAVPSSLDLWPTILARVNRQLHGTPWTRLFPNSRFGWVGLTFAVLLFLSATVYAAAPVISRLLQMDEQLKGADSASLGQSLDLSQTIGNVAVTVQWAYADTDRILIGYAIKSSDGRRFDPYSEALTDAAGMAFRASTGYGVTGQSDVLGVTLPPGEGTFIRVFENKVTTEAKPLSLRLTLYVQELILPSTPDAHSLDSGVVQVQPLNAATVIGPFTFDFTIPVVSAGQLR